jgi:hypothetical protein
MTSRSPAHIRIGYLPTTSLIPGLGPYHLQLPQQFVLVYADTIPASSVALDTNTGESLIRHYIAESPIVLPREQMWWRNSSGQNHTAQCSSIYHYDRYRLFYYFKLRFFGLWTGFDSQQRKGIFPFATAPRPALGPTQPPIQRVRRPLCEADHSPQSTAEVKNAWNYTSTASMRLHGMVLERRIQLYGVVLS